MITQIFGNVQLEEAIRAEQNRASSRAILLQAFVVVVLVRNIMKNT